MAKKKRQQAIAARRHSDRCRGAPHPAHPGRARRRGQGQEEVQGRGPGRRAPRAGATARAAPGQARRRSGLALAPRFIAPDYRGSGKLEGFAAIVTGGDSGIGRAVAVLFAREGADVAVIYLDSHGDARETRRGSRPKAGAAC